MVTGRHCPSERLDGTTTTQTQLMPLAGRLVERGHDVTVYVPSDDDSSAAGTTPGVRVDYVDVGADDRDMPARYADGLRLRWRDEAPELVHAVSWTAGLATAATERDDVAVVQDYRGDDSYQDRQLQRLTAALGQRAEQTVVASNAQADALVQRGVSRQDVCVVPLAVDDQLFVPGGPPVEHEDQLVVCPDGTADGHGSDLLIRSLPYAPDAELLIVDHPGSESAGEDRRDLAAELDVADRVDLVNASSTAELASLFRSADLVVSTPTTDASIAGCVAAMACGTAVLATGAGGREEVVVDKVTGQLVAPRPEQLGTMMHRLLHDPPRRRAYGIAAADRVSACYSWDRVTDGVEGVYTNALSGRFSGSPSRGSFRPDSAA